MDLSFLKHIREVTGYVLISHVDVRQIVLPSLQVIRGRTRFRLNVHDDEFALMVTLSRMDNLELPALRGKSKLHISSIFNTVVESGMAFRPAMHCVSDLIFALEQLKFVDLQLCTVRKVGSTSSYTFAS